MTVHLCFHGIGRCTEEREPGESRYWVAEGTFHRMLDAVAGEQDVELSFDDGNASDLEIAVPALRDRGLTASFFALAGRLDDPASLSPADLREVVSAGMRVGSHGWRHVSWRGLSPAEEQREFEEARGVLAEACGESVTRVALPLGQYDRRVLRGLRRAGYETVYTSDRFRARPGAWLQARFSVTCDDTPRSVLRTVRERRLGPELRNLVVSGVKRMR